MLHYEIIFENGEHAVGAADDEDDILAGVKNHHERAKNGLPGGPPAFDRETGAAIAVPPAVRVKRVLVYEDHPAELSVAEQTSADAVKKRFKTALEQATNDDGTVDVFRLHLLMIPQPMVVTPPHESNYAATEVKELSPGLWGGEE